MSDFVRSDEADAYEQDPATRLYVDSCISELQSAVINDYDRGYPDGTRECCRNFLFMYGMTLACVDQIEEEIEDMICSQRERWPAFGAW